MFTIVPLSVFAVLPLYGQPPLLFLLSVGAPGPKVSPQQDRIHPERDAELHPCECLSSTQCSSSFNHLRACVHRLFCLQPLSVKCFCHVLSSSSIINTLCFMHIYHHTSKTHITRPCCFLFAPLLLHSFQLFFSTGFD